jgi:hypothetical protein
MATIIYGEKQSGKSALASVYTWDVRKRGIPHKSVKNSFTDHAVYRLI